MVVAGGNQWAELQRGEHHNFAGEAEEEHHLVLWRERGGRRERREIKIFQNRRDKQHFFRRTVEWCFFNHAKKAKLPSTQNHVCIRI